MDSGGFSNFLGQLPPILYIVFCGSSLALAFALAFIVYTRGKKAGAVAVGASGAMPIMASSGSDLPGDFPDLDDLLNPAALPTESTPAPRTARGGMFSVRLADGDEVEVAEVLTVLRDVADGGLIIQIGDKAYRNPPALADAEFKRRFNSTLRDLSQSAVSAPPPKPPAPPPPTPVAADDDELPTESALLGSSNGTAAPLRPITSPPVAPASVPLPGDLPKFKLPDTPPQPPKRGRKPVAEPIPEINIANAIEAFLQHKLSLTPEYSGRTIHVRPASHGGVLIEVDDKFYDTVGDVEDEAVRDFLTATIAEWQSRQ